MPRLPKPARPHPFPRMELQPERRQNHPCQRTPQPQNQPPRLRHALPPQRHRRRPVRLRQPNRHTVRRLRIRRRTKPPLADARLRTRTAQPPHLLQRLRRRSLVDAHFQPQMAGQRRLVGQTLPPQRHRENLRRRLHRIPHRLGRRICPDPENRRVRRLRLHPPHIQRRHIRPPRIHPPHRLIHPV